MLLNQVEMPILLGLPFRHYLNDAPANTSTLTWHLLSLLLSPTSSVRHWISPLESWVVFKGKEICLYSQKWHFFVDEPSIFFHLWTLNCMLLWQHFYSWKYPATPSHFKKNSNCSEPNCCLAPCTDAWYESEPEQWKAIYYMMASSSLC